MYAKRLSLSLLDGLLLLLLAGVLAFLGYRVSVQLNYQWNWGAIPQFLFRYDAESGRWMANYLTQGLLTTLRLSLWASLLALVFGFAVALARISNSLYLRLLARTFTELMRNLPPLVIIFLFYYFLADQLVFLTGSGRIDADSHPWLTRLSTIFLAPPAQIAPFVSALITLAVFESAYVAEIVRAGILSIYRGQWEACHALGLSRWQSLRYVILPQTLRRMMPPLAGQLVSLIKDSSIVSVIAIQELTYQGSQLMASTYLTFEVWLTVAAMYLLLTFPCSILVERLNQRLNRLQERSA
ncbi:MAG: amino acid ABC transporter permease [Desulfobulbaceae bacterium]|nr:amino acid ABC transporter permease [Desulfobulbaceae bacterium]